jgi:subtilisin-like proprotein convertase family protein
VDPMKIFAIALFLVGCAGNLVANQPPTIGSISDHEVLQDQPTDAIPLVLTDAETPVLGLRLTGSSSNPKLVPTANIFFGSAFGRWYTSVTPAFGEVGEATITITVSDGQLSTNTSFHLTVNPPPDGWRRFVDSSPIGIPDLGKAAPYPAQINITDAPGTITNVILTISKFSHQNIHDVNMLLVGPTGQGVIIFSHIAGPRSVSNVTVYLTDRSAFPLPQNFDLWSEPLRPTAYSPVPSFPAPAPAGPYGPVALSTFKGLPANGTWSLYITDDTGTNHGSITGGWSLMIATTTNLAPTISDIPNQSVFPDSSTASIPFSIDDADTSIENLTLSASSSDASVVPPENIIIEGTGASHTVRVTPVAGQGGSATITVTVSDGLNSASDSFVLTVGSPNSTPNIGQIGNRTTLVDTPVGPFSIFVSDPETPVGNLSITGTSSNPRLVPNANIICFNAGVQTVTLIPARGQIGATTITIFASDGIASASRSFVLTVNPPGFGTGVFENASFIPIEESDTAALYPSSIEITEVPGAIKQLAVTLRGLSHTLPDDLDILLVGPSGKGVVLFSDAGGSTPANDLNLTLSDQAEFAVPDEFRLLPGTYRPADFLGSDG